MSYKGKKKIVFCLQTMVLGGVEKELITIFKKMSPYEYDITLVLLYVSDEEIMQQIPNYVNIINLDIDKKYFCDSLVNLCKLRIIKGHFFEAAMLATKRILHIGASHSNTNISSIRSLAGSYDIAVCYHIHSPLSLRYVAEKISASKKIAWIHNDFFTTRFPVERLTKFLDKYHKIVAVSRQVEHEFLQLCPKYREIVCMCHNIVDEDEIINKANETIEDSSFFDTRSYKLLTVGRFEKQKGFDIAIKTAAILKKNNVDFKWFFIGSGQEEKEYKRLIAENEVENEVVILGRRNNPYPYIKKCDLYIQPSRHEAYAIVILEAKVLNTPIICSNFAGADEQIIDGITGRIVQKENSIELSIAIQELLSNYEVRSQFSQALENETNTEGWMSIESIFQS